MFGYNEILPGFTVIEGIDGAGTSTQRKMLCQAFEAAGIACFDTWEPSENPVGTLLRRALRAEIQLEPGTVARLFASDRHEHLEGVGGIRAQLAAGRRVVCDRYVFSSLAYQGFFMPENKVWELNQDFPLPSALIFLDIDLEISSMRRQKRGGVEEITETAPIQKHVRAAYQRMVGALAETRPEIRILQLDGNDTVGNIHQAICGFLQVPALRGRY